MKDKLESLISEMYHSGITYNEGLREFKKRFILHVLRENRENQCKAARELLMHRNTLPRTAREVGLQRVSGKYVDRLLLDSRKEVQASDFPSAKKRQA